jgi:hypothetical protein
MVSKATPLLWAKARRESALSTLSCLSLCPFTSKLIRISLLYTYIYSEVHTNNAPKPASKGRIRQQRPLPSYLLKTP